MGFWDKEGVLYIKFDKEPMARDRRVSEMDKFVVTTDKKGNVITLEEDKKLYPFKIDNTVRCTIQTNFRTISFLIPQDYRWNGADIPRILWLFVGSQFNPEFKVPSLIHDFMLEYKEQIYGTLEDITVPQYRRLTSLAFRQCLKDEGVRTVKSNIMSGLVQCFQATLNRKEWNIG